MKILMKILWFLP